MVVEEVVRRLAIRCQVLTWLDFFRKAFRDEKYDFDTVRQRVL